MTPVPEGGDGGRPGPLRRLRTASKLDKVRWVIVYSTDLVPLLSLIGFYVLYLQWQAGMPPALAMGAAVLLAVFVVICLRPFRAAVRGGPRPTALLAVSGALALLLAVVAVVWALPSWLGTLAPFVRRRTIVLLSAGSITTLTLIGVLSGAGFADILALVTAMTFMTVISVGATLANLALWRLAQEAHEGEEALARLAVSEERLRFARDLNDLLGQSLTDVAARAGHAEERLRADPEAAAAEMFEVRDLARRSLREVRTVVQNYRAVDLDEVLASVRAVLEAAGVRCAVRADTAGLTPESRTLLATVVREGTTNVLKHSRAERCEISIEDGVLEMSNDGVSGPVGRHAPNGLAGLAERVRAAGGSLEAAPTPEGRYLLRAAVPA
ncbi:Sensor histidine kinase DesK [Nonomuraea coxensis DSM 45129]|uniref:Sensor histidine kinase DesK n=1 Tax=Nonomuraea coxensis DSM 45129 TaxID=1122611 RepID=A0ABX8U783_9ACTN|nr:histidine kinase [Nonomuraea coxensis]QYC43627.1 Sensor histidine kinase DesK [Nonomuraea coxensis DSM 45129]